MISLQVLYLLNLVILFQTCAQLYIRFSLVKQTVSESVSEHCQRWIFIPLDPTCTAALDI